MIDIVLASNNAHKMKEFKNLFKGYDINFYLMKDLNISENADENGKNYIENAVIKVNSIKDQTNFYILSDDSGVEFEALGEHFPGVHSKRYADSFGGNEVLNPKLVKDIPGTKASFFSSLALITPDKKIVTFLAEVKGKVSDKLEGTNGFGYDNIFIPDGENHTYAYFEEDYKNKISHRAKATEMLLKYFKENNLI